MKRSFASTAAFLLGLIVAGHASFAAASPLFAQQARELTDEEAAGILAAVMGVGLIFLVIVIAIWIVVALLFKGCLARIPAQYREVEPNMAWLLVIPCVNLVANFLVIPKIGKSFANYFHANGRPDVGDGGQQLGLWYSIVFVCQLVPFLNYIAGPAALVLLIIVLVKFLGLKKQIPEGAV